MSKTATPEEKGFFQSLDDYWFGHGSTTTLGVFRIFVGTLAFINFFLIGLHWEAWFSERGYTPAWLGQLWLNPTVRMWKEPIMLLGRDLAELPRLNLLNGITDPRITIPFYILGMLAAVTTALGLWTRASSIVLAVVIVSLHHRNASVLHGGDTVIRLLALYIALSPAGTACSIDRLIGLWKGKISPAPATASLWVQRMVCYNMAIVYFTTVWLKYFGNLWRDGTATYYPARLAEFYRFPVPSFMNDLPMVRITTYGTLLVEFALATLVFFRPLRKWVLISGILMHGYIEYSMNIPLFSYLMVSMYICFYDGEEVSAWAKRVGARLKRLHVTIHLPKGSRLKPNAAAFLDAVDPFGLVHYIPSDHETWSAVRADGKRAEPVGASGIRSIGAYPFLWIPKVWARFLNASTETTAPVEGKATTQARS